MNAALFYTNQKNCGGGHAKRCEIIAEELNKRGVSVTHATSPFKINSIRREPPDIAIIDMLNITQEFINKIRFLPSRPVVVVIVTDNKKTDYRADIVLNASACLPNKIIEGPKRMVIIGPNYNILDPKYREAHRKRRVIKKRIKRVLVCCGAEDPKRKTLEAIKALENTKYEVTIITGRKFAYNLPMLPEKFIAKKDLPCLADEFLKVDLAVVSCGITLYESSTTGTPTIAIPKDDLEMENARAFEKNGTCFIGMDKLSNVIRYDARKKMSNNGKRFVTPLGTETIIKKIYEKLEDRRYLWRRM